MHIHSNSRVTYKVGGILLLFFTLITTSCFSSVKLLDSLTLDTLKAYTSIEEALKEPEKVIKLILKRKRYKTFPAAIFTFTNLQYLDISKNSITKIPPEIGTLQNLQYLSVSKNKLEGLPYEIGELSNLFYLNGSRNDLFTLPVSIGKLTKLRYLDLWDNNIDFLPEEIKKCKKLKLLDLRGIIISQTKQDHIQALLRHTKIYFSPPCKCSQ